MPRQVELFFETEDTEAVLVGGEILAAGEEDGDW